MNDAPALEARIAAAIDGRAEANARVLSHNLRRRVLAFYDLPSGPVAVKLHEPRTLGRRLRDRLKSALGVSAAQREARILALLERSSLTAPAPLPLAPAMRVRGRACVAMAFVEGPTLSSGLPYGPAERRSLMGALGRALARVHRAGVVHRDLHADNVLLSKDGPVFIDWQRARRRGDARARLLDIARFEFSLQSCGVARGDRIRFRYAALGLSRSDARTADGRRRTREVGRAVRARAAAHYAARTRRCLRGGDGFDRWRSGAWRGLAREDLDVGPLMDAQETHRRLSRESTARVTDPIGRIGPSAGEAVLKRDHRSVITAFDFGGRRVVMKQVRKAGIARRLADAFRGSPARRGFVGARGLAIRGFAVASPLAFGERRVFGWPVESWLLLEDMRCDCPLFEINFSGIGGSAVRRPVPASTSSMVPRDAAGFEGFSKALCDRVVDLLVALHRADVSHGDLQALHIYVRATPGEGARENSEAFELALIDTDTTRFGAKLGDADRILDLAALNASIADHVLDDAARAECFRTYAGRVPFACGPHEALERVVSASLARGHMWRTDRGRRAGRSATQA